ncbi:MAG: molybdopterin-binding protein [Rhizobiaceae bacterium]
MKFGPIAVAKAKGAILAHAYALPNGRLKKGHQLDDNDINALITANVRTVIVAQLDTNDIGENEAALRVTDGLKELGISVEEPFTGRANLHAMDAGVFFANSELIDMINRISPSVTVATLNDGMFVEAGRLVATVKIIPFAVEREVVEEIELLLATKEALTIVPSQPHQIGLIATELPSLKKTTMDKTASVLATRLARAGSEIVEEIRVAHTSKAVASALTQLKQNCSLIILFGASAITDINDVIPTALCDAGGKVDTFGMPVDPGNLLLTGQLGDIPVIGAPGCARSPAENGFDWVLQRILAGISVDENYISGLGVGGLLMEIHSRPQPRSVAKGEA